MSRLETRGRDGEHRPRIVVFGVGGAGGNAVANMLATGLDGVELVVANTDAQALARHRPEHRLQLGLGITEGLGAGARPDVGRRAAEDSLADIVARIGKAHMVFVTAGMGGGTGTGAAPVIARAARDAGALVVAVVTKPFEFEGAKRMRIADEGVRLLEPEVDTLLVIPNQNLFRVANEKTSISEAFAMADGVLHSGVRGVTDLMTRPGLVNLDFADVRTVMSEMGKAVMGCGEADGPRRALDAAQRAIANPLLDDMSLRGATAALINITGGPGLTLYDVDEAANVIRADIEPDANIIVGSAIDETLGEAIRVSVVATGMQRRDAIGAAARPRRLESAREPESLGGPRESVRLGSPRGMERLGGPDTEEMEAGGFTFERPARELRPRHAIADMTDLDDELRFGEPEAEEEDSTALGVIAALGAKPAPKAPVIDARPEPIVVEPAEREPRGFSLFGRKKRRDEPSRAVAPVEPPADDDLEIPAFLRRQAN